MHPVSQHYHYHDDNQPETHHHHVHDLFVRGNLRLQRQDEDGATTKSCTDGSTTTLGRRAVLDTAAPTETAAPYPESNNHLEARGSQCPNVYVDDYIVYPRDPDNVSNFVDYLKNTRSQLDESATLWSKTLQVQGGARGAPLRCFSTSTR